MTATLVIGLVIDAIRKRGSSRIGLPFSTSAIPCALRWTILPSRATRLTAPAISFSAIDSATPEVLAHPATAAAHATEALGMPAPLLAPSVPYSNLVARPAKEARADVERMLSAMSGPDMDAINGKLPDSGFYL